MHEICSPEVGIEGGRGNPSPIPLMSDSPTLVLRIAYSLRWSKKDVFFDANESIQPSY